MMPNKYEQKKKAFIAMKNELYELEDFLRNNEVLIPFEKPVHKGWMVSVDLRKDIANRKDAPFIRKIVEMTRKPYHIRSVARVKAIRRGETGYSTTNFKGQRIWVDFMPHSILFSQKEYERMEPQVQKYFYLNKWAVYPWERVKYKAYIPSYWLILKVRPHYVTHYVSKGGPLEKRKQFLRDKLEEYWRTTSGYYGNKGYWRYQYRPTTRNHIRRFLKKEIEDIPQVNYKNLIKR